MQHLPCTASFTDAPDDYIDYRPDALQRADESADILAQLEQKELWQQIIVALSDLPPASREACWLYFEKGLKIPSIARLLNISRSAAYNHLTRGLYLLQCRFAGRPK